MPAQDSLKQIISSLPLKPGIYKYFDAEGELLYIGKAKSLKKRVSSYFTKQHYESNKTKRLVSLIDKIEFTIVDTEYDALLLENILIKQYQPRYNVSLKDDKTYPFIKITNERFPKLFPTRRLFRDGAEYYGPYASVEMMYTILDLVKAIYPLRNCNLNLTEESIQAKKFKICLEYQIGNCKGPCEGYQSEEDYMASIKAIAKILKGNVSEVLYILKEQMATAAEQFKFEEAHQLKLKYNKLLEYQGRSTIVSQSITNLDVFSIAEEQNFAFINFLRVANGMIIQAQTIELKKKIDETTQELLQMGIAEIQNRYGNTSKEIVVPFEIELENQNIIFTVPKVGDKKKLLDLSLKNVLYFKRDKLAQYEKVNPDVRSDRILAQMQKDLRLPHPPKRIDCFDNSNFQGAYPVSAMVCFIDAKPAKKEYRHYKVKTVVGPDDFATMHEVITRRYSRVLEEKLPLPQLIIVDGGKGQLSSAVDALQKLDLFGKIPIIGIAKRLEELYYPGDELPLYIDKKSETLKTIQQLRDEAHRFGITFHRKLRNQGTLATELEDIEGIGDATAEKLLKYFRSVKKIKEAAIDELDGLVGKAKAKLVYEYFNPQK